MIESTADQLGFIFSSMEDAVCVTDASGRLCYANRAALRLLGIPENEMKKEKIWELFPFVEENDELIQLFIDAVTNKQSIRQALVNYENAVNNKCDTSSVRYKIGYIQYQNQNYPAALGSFIKSYDSNSSDTHLLLALANTLSKNNDNYVAKGYYERLINVLNANKQKYHIVLPQVREDQADLVDTYMKATNNLGVTLHRIANNNGDSSLNATAIVNLQESLRSWDALTRNQITMVRLEGSNLAEQNIKYMTHPTLQYEPELYTEIPRKLENEKGLGL